MNKIHSHRNELAASQAFCMILPKALIGFREIFFLFLVADLSFFPGPLSRNASEMAGYLR